MPDFAFEVAPNDAATCKSLVEKYETEGLELTLDVAGTTARCVRPSKRSRLGYVNVFHYYFRSTERMFEFCDKHLVDLEAKREYKAKRAVEKKERINDGT